jgi:hypothetical protein
MLYAVHPLSEAGESNGGWKEGYPSAAAYG